MSTSGQSLRSLLAEWAKVVSGTSLPQPPSFNGPDISITGFVEHTDYVKPGVCFVARVRTGTDGHPHIGEAVRRGASLIIGQRPRQEIEPDLGSTPYLHAEDSSLVEAWLAAAFYGFPARRLVVVGVTGTDGKTTTANLIFEILSASGIKVGMLSTIKASFGANEEPQSLHVTTPEAPVFQNYLRRMVDLELTHCVLEVTSHGLSQNRVAAVDFDVAVVTNITHEHLDYHGDFQEYLKAKSRLFHGLTKSMAPDGTLDNLKSTLIKTSVLNIDDDSFSTLAPITVPRQITYGLNESADIYATAISFSSIEARFILNFPPVDFTGDPANSATPISSRMIGLFNVYNALAASAAAYVLGIRPETIKSGIEGLDQLSGRMERVDLGQPFQIVIDFAHTPNALEKSIEAARGMTRGKIITVFGSAGKRDVAKRVLMAKVSARLADLSVLTAEDPRTDSLDEILESMASGCLAQGAVEGKSFWRIKDRGQAIFFALTLAQEDDLILICGKGHEGSMCFGRIEHPWNEVEATRTALSAFLADCPPPDLGLPTFDPNLDLNTLVGSG